MKSQKNGTTETITRTVEKIRRLSFSKLSYFSSCPRKFYYKYVENLPQPEAIPLIFGKSFHKASGNGYTKMVANTTPSESEVVENAVTEFEKSVEIARSSAAGLEKADTAPKEKDLLARAQGCYYKKAMLKKKPLEVEKMFKMKFKNGGLEVIGYIDLIEDDGGKKINEMKTSARAQDLAMFSRQTALYGKSQGIDRVQVELIIKKQEPEIVVGNFQITQDDYNNVLANVQSVGDVIANLIPKPKEFWWQNIGFGCGMCWYKELCLKKIGERKI